MQSLAIVIFAHFVKIQPTFLFFFTAIDNDREITQKKQRPGPNPNDIKTAIFCRIEEVQIVQRLLCSTRLNK